MENKYESAKIQFTIMSLKTNRQNITIAAAYCLQGENLKPNVYQEFSVNVGDRFSLWRRRKTFSLYKYFLKRVGN